MSKITGNEPINAIIPYNEFEKDIERGYPFGLTKREHFAAMAMQGLLANIIYHNPNEKHKMVTVSALAETSVSYADALI